MGQPDLTYPPPPAPVYQDQPQWEPGPEPPVVPAPAMGLQVNPDLLDDADTGPHTLPPGVYPVEVGVPAGRIELFRVSGRIYTVPAAVDPRIVFRFIRKLKKSGSEELAMAEMMYETLGEAVVDALADEDLDPAQLQQVMRAVTKYTMSGMTRAGLGN